MLGKVRNVPIDLGFHFPSIGAHLRSPPPYSEFPERAWHVPGRASTTVMTRFCRVSFVPEQESWT
jgi:hypothetical protein